jgi:hypothetical protein
LGQDKTYKIISTDPLFRVGAEINFVDQGVMGPLSKFECSNDIIWKNEQVNTTHKPTCNMFKLEPLVKVKQPKYVPLTFYV